MLSKEDKDRIRCLPENELLALRSEIGKDIEKLGRKIVRKRAVLQVIKNELAKRAEKLQAKGSFLVSDHAVVRYLQRHRNLDIDAVKDEIRALAKNGHKIGANGLIRSGDIVLASNRDTSTITTIMGGTTHDLLED